MPLSQIRRSPGVYRVDAPRAPRPGRPTGVPAFLGRTESGTTKGPVALSQWTQFAGELGPPRADGFLGAAVHGFFANNGRLCYVVPLDEQLEPEHAVAAGLTSIRDLDDVDLVC